MNKLNVELGSYHFYTISNGDNSDVRVVFWKIHCKLIFEDLKMCNFPSLCFIIIIYLFYFIFKLSKSGSLINEKYRTQILGKLQFCPLLSSIFFINKLFFMLRKIEIT